MKKVKELGYESKYIKFLLEKYRKKTTRRFAGYFYNESLNKASLITESGRCLILQQVPIEIEGQIKRKINESRGLGNNRYRIESFH